MIPSDMKGRAFPNLDIVKVSIWDFNLTCMIFSPHSSFYEENSDINFPTEGCGSDHVGGGPLV